MARKQSAGTLLYRLDAGELQVLLVHASGWYNKNKPWGIPKGLIDEGESHEQAARRETLEETGIRAGTLHSLGHIDYRKSRKRIHAFTGELPEATDPQCVSWEIDAAEVMPLAEARTRIHPDQEPFLDRLLEHLASKT